jgi:hypothetical protein
MHIFGLSFYVPEVVVCHPALSRRGNISRRKPLTDRRRVGCGPGCIHESLAARAHPLTTRAALSPNHLEDDKDQKRTAEAAAT